MTEQKFRMFYGYISRFNPDKYTVDVEILPMGKTITNIPISYLNSFHAYGITVIPAPNQEVLVIQFEKGPAMILPIVTKQFKESYQGARPQNFDYGDIYITTPNSRIFSLASGVFKIELGSLDNNVGELIFATSEDNTKSGLVIKSDVVDVRSADTRLLFGRSLDTPTDRIFTFEHDSGDRKIRVEIPPNGSFKLSVRDSTNQAEVTVTHEMLQVQNGNVTLEIGDGIKLLLSSGYGLSMDSQGNLRISASSIEVNAGRINLDAGLANLRADNTRLSAQQLGISADMCEISSRSFRIQSETATISANGIIMNGNVQVGGQLTARARIESLSEIWAGNDRVVTRGALRPALDSLFNAIMTVANAYNAHVHAVAAAATVSTTPTVVLATPRPAV